MFDEEVLHLYTDNASGEVDLVKELPEDVRAEKIRQYRQRIESAQYMLKI